MRLNVLNFLVLMKAIFRASSFHRWDSLSGLNRRGIQYLFSHFICKKLSVEDVAETVDLLNNAFPWSSPYSWARAVGQPEGSLEGYLKDYLPKPLSEEEVGSYGFTCNDGDKSILKGVIILETLHRGGTIENNIDDDFCGENLPPYKAIEALMSKCNSIFYETLQLKKGFEAQKVCYVAWIGTQEKYRRQGVGTALIRYADEAIREGGYDCAVAFCANPTSTKLFHSQGYSFWGGITYSDFRFNSTKPFAIIPDEITVMVKEYSK